jgi:hypothetical protein
VESRRRAGSEERLDDLAAQASLEALRKDRDLVRPDAIIVTVFSADRPAARR